MNEEKDIKSIKISLPYVTEDGKSVLKPMTVTFKTVIEKEKADYNNSYTPIYSMNMSMVIPDHIHAKLCGATVARSTEFSKVQSREYGMDLSKTITSSSLDSVTTQYRNIILDYKWLIHKEQLKLNKVIFYNFEGTNKSSTTSTWDSKQTGSKTDISYSFLIGYISECGKYRYNSDKKALGNRDGGNVEAWNFVEYSEKAEHFFNTIFVKFGDLLSQLMQFKSSITAKFIEDMLAGGGIKLLG